MRRVVLVTVLISSVLLADSTSNRYGVIESLHSKESQKKIQDDLSKGLKKKEKYTKDIKEIISFMENFKMLSQQQRNEAKQFQKYVDTHIESVAACKNLENDFKVDIKNNISADEKTLYREEIQECKDDLADSTISYESAETFFNEALATLKNLKFKNKIAGKRYKVLESKLKSVNALVDYLNTTK